MPKTWLPITSMCLTVALGCAVKDGNADGATTTDDATTDDSSSNTATAETTETSDTNATSETGDPGSCDPSDIDIGPAVEITIQNQSAAPLYLTEATNCAFGSPFSIAHGVDMIRWIFGICESCGEALEGICQCPGPCVLDSVIRIDPGGRYVGSWSGGSIFPATLTPACANESCGDQCAAIAQADAGDYVASAIASPMVTCEFDPCDCLDAPDPDGWCRLDGTRAGGDITREVAFAYPGETAVELSFD